MVEYFSVPLTCPKCGFPTLEKGSFLYCNNKSCDGKILGLLKVWIDRLGILNWGDAIIESLTSGDNPVVKSIPDIYLLSIDDLSQHCSGSKHAKKCYDHLHAHKTLSLDLVLAGLNIQLLGLSTAADIVNNGYDTIDKILKLVPEDLVNIPNIGPKTAEIIYAGLSERHESLSRLSSILSIKPKNNGPLVGKSFCISGETKIPRRSLQKQILDNGGVIKESVVSGLSYLVCNEDVSYFSSDKIKKAKKYNTTIITEDHLLSLITNI